MPGGVYFISVAGYWIFLNVHAFFVETMWVMFHHIPASQATNDMNQSVNKLSILALTVDHLSLYLHHYLLNMLDPSLGSM